MHPSVLQDLASAKSKGGIPNQQLRYEVLGPFRDMSPVLLWKFILSLLDALKQVALTGSTGFPALPATVAAAVAGEGRAAAKQDVEDDP